jgi:hypothetical protein
MAARALAASAALALVAHVAAGTCAHLNNCNGHGTCDTVNSRCICFNG